MLTYLRDSSRFPRGCPCIDLNNHTPSGQSRVYRVTQLRTDGVHVITFLSGLVLLRFRLYAFVEAAALRSIVLRYAGAPIATRVSFLFFLFLLIWGCRFFRIIFVVPLPFILRMESTITVVRYCLPGGVFLPCDHGLDICHQLIM